jgi:hypothetical protein
MQYKHLKFHGNFRDLIPGGWKFQRLFAENFITYTKEFLYDHCCTVWKRDGGYMTVGVHCLPPSQSYLIALFAAGYTPTEQERKDGISTYFDTETNEILCPSTRRDIQNKIWDAELEEKKMLWKKYREIDLYADLLDFLKHALDSGMISVEDGLPQKRI